MDGSKCVSLFAALLQLLSVDGLRGQPAEDPSPHSSAELIPEVRSVRPGEPFTVGLRLTLDPGWHSYWQNPGDAGQPASIYWTLPAGFRAGQIEWPYPKVVEESSVVSYGYEDDVLLMTEISPPRFMTTGQTLTVAAEARWLVCANICLPASAQLEFEIPLDDEPPIPDERWLRLFSDARSRLPTPSDGWLVTAVENAENIVLEIAASEVDAISFEGARFFPIERGVLDHGARQVLSRASGMVRIGLRKSRFLQAPVARLSGVLVLGDFLDFGAAQTRALLVDVVVSPAETTRGCSAGIM